MAAAVALVVALVAVAVAVLDNPEYSYTYGVYCFNKSIIK
jgi:hypothetical protein